MGKINQVDMCRGALLSKIIVFALPLLATYILTHLFHAADLLVIGRFSKPQSMAAIGATGSLIGFFIGVTCAMSVGAQVLCAQAFGANDRDAMQKSIHTAFTATIIISVLFTIISFILTRKVLLWLATPEDIIDKSVLYVRIFLLCLPSVALSACGSAVLRAVGDTIKPLLFLIISGIVNVVLNLFFVIVCKIDVAGVAAATSIANILSMILTLNTMMKNSGICHLSLKKLSIELPTLYRLLKIAIPSAVQGSCFSLSNMVIQSTINLFGSLAVAGGVTSNIFESIIYVVCFSLNLTATSFVAQNYGGHKYKRILKAILCCMATTLSINIVLSGMCCIFANELCGFFNPDPEVIRWAVERVYWVIPCYFICGFMEVFCGGLRGLGYSLLPAMSSIFGACIFRIWWAKSIFPHYRTMASLLISYPISWILIASISGSIFFIIYFRIVHKKTLHFSRRQHMLQLCKQKNYSNSL